MREISDQRGAGPRVQGQARERDPELCALPEDVAELTKVVTDLHTAMAEATKLRQEETEKDTHTIKDSKEAQTAVAQALTVLKGFYEGAGNSTALTH